MAANVYEGLFIFDSNLYGHDPNGVSSQITEMITNLGGEILVSRLWEERRLAYPIKGQRKGTYWLIYFRLDGEQVSELKKQYLIKECLLRSLILKVDPRIVETLVEHARSAPVTTSSDESKVADKSEKVLAAVELDEDEVDVDVDEDNDNEEE
ncbi:MAG: 30S ribosomal protein S6 [Thermoguttaceae bacterium]